MYALCNINNYYCKLSAFYYERWVLNSVPEVCLSQIEWITELSVIIITSQNLSLCKFEK